MALSILDFKTWKSITKRNFKAVSTYFCLDLHSAIFSVLAGIGSSIKRVEKLVDMLKQKMKGLFQVQSLISNEQTQLKVQVNKGGERIVREYWDPKSEDLVSELQKLSLMC